MKQIKENMIGSGQTYVGKSAPLILTAISDSCVSISLYDKNAKVGGMAHFLLAKPYTACSKEPDKYASTGLPNLLKTMYEKGASHENITANIAGGALTGVIKEFEMAFDIGGHTVETVYEILKNENIEIEKAETGGTLCYKTSLNLLSGKTTISHAYYNKKKQAETSYKETKIYIKKSLNNIKPIPQIILKIFRMINENNYDFDDITKEVKKDQVISAKVLQLCNTAFFSRSKKIDSISHALVILGEDILVKSIILTYIKDFYNQSIKCYSLSKGGLFKHSLGTAVIAEKIAEITGENRFSAYSSGLLHDIGMLVLDQSLPDGVNIFYNNINKENQGLLKIENNLFDLDHCTAGYMLARKWELPDTICDAVLNHHDPKKTWLPTKLTYIINVADIIMSHFYAGMNLDYLDNTRLESHFKLLGLQNFSFEELVDTVTLNLSKELL